MADTFSTQQSHIQIYVFIGFSCIGKQKNKRKKAKLFSALFPYRM